MCTNRFTRTLAVAATLCAVGGNLAANAAQPGFDEAGLVPEPVKVAFGPGTFLVSGQRKILYEKGSAGAQAAAEYLAEAWQFDLGSHARFRRPVSQSPAP